MPINRQITLVQRPLGMPRESDFAMRESPLPEVGEGQFLVRTQYVSVDPYMRGHISGRKSYIEPVPLGAVMPGGAVGVVAQSRHPEYQVGEVVLGGWGWQDYGLCDGRGVSNVDVTLGPVSTALGVLGMPGMTAYFGMLDVGAVKKGASVFVSGAAGAVGSVAGQLARIEGCRVAGSAGSDAKVRYLLDEARFDAAFNYRTVPSLDKALREACPTGIDVYFDNVGGPMTDAVFPLLNDHARVVVCGQIDQYNSTEAPTGPRLLWHLIVKRARAEGFLVFDYASRYGEARQAMARWLREGRLVYHETITEGLENTPKAFIGLFSGENLGKQLVKVS